MDIFEYLTAKGFIPTITLSDVVVYIYLNDRFLTLYYHPLYNIIEVIYNDDYEEPMYRGSPNLEEFNIILNQMLLDLVL